MTSITRRILLGSALALGLAGAAAAEFPERQITLVIPFAAGGSTDVVGRIVADRMSRDLRKRGFNFVGPTICYAFMQATGMVDDHLNDCFVRSAGGQASRPGS